MYVVSNVKQCKNVPPLSTAALFERLKVGEVDNLLVEVKSLRSLLVCAKSLASKLEQARNKQVQANSSSRANEREERLDELALLCSSYPIIFRLMTRLLPEIAELKDQVAYLNQRLRALSAEEREERLAILGAMTESTKLLNTLITQRGNGICSSPGSLT